MQEFPKALSDNYLWIIIATLALNLLQGKLCARSQAKRKATLIIATLEIAFQAVLVLVVSKGASPLWLLAALVVVIAIAIVFRKQVWPFRAHCAKCRKTLPFKTILADDLGLCAECLKAEHPEFDKEHPSVEEASPWDNWEPKAVFADCYILDGKGNVLLIERKETGLGYKKVCAPGGQLEADETATQCAIREVYEEVGLTVSNPVHVGYVNFAIPDNNLRGHIYIATDFNGEPVETEEAKPFWTSVENIPYERLFDDAQIWLKHALKNEKFDFYGVCDDNGKLLSHEFILEHNNTLKAHI